MYRIGKHSNVRLRKAIWSGIVVILVGLIGFGVYTAYKAFTAPQQQATLPAAVVHEFAPPAAAERTFTEDYFTMKLPEDWQMNSHSTESMYNKYTYQATAKNKDNRWLEVYVDRVPDNQSFNRILPVFLNENRIVVASSVSDNCTEFTGDKVARPAATVETLPAKWQGVAFNCDIANYIRNVVGIGSPENGHNLPLTGASGNKHIYYFVYIDHNINPDYQILERALMSFTPK